MPFENSKIVWNWMVGIVGDRLILCRTFLATRASSVQLYVIAYNDLISKLMVVTDCVYKHCNSQFEAVHTHNSAFSHVVCESSSHQRDLAGPDPLTSCEFVCHTSLTILVCDVISTRRGDLNRWSRHERILPRRGGTGGLNEWMCRLSTCLPAKKHHENNPIINNK